MCGFGGIVNANAAVQPGRLEEIAKAVSHRGPDSTGLLLYDEIFRETASPAPNALFFNRLAIIDLAARSNQPFRDERFTLLFNGEIYNYKEIKTELAGKGVSFKTASDTEVLFYALQVWRSDALLKLNGMFSFFWLDRVEQSFLVARDRTGIKPLYYKVENGSFIFGSEMDSVVRFSQQSPTLSAAAVNSYLLLQYIPTPLSIIDGISKLPPGHFIQGSIKTLKANGGIEPVCYWDGYKQAMSDKRDLRVQDFEQLLVESIRGQLVADVPLGLFLSSGVDSSLLTALINKHFRDGAYDFFTVAFDQASASDESHQAAQYIEGFKNPRLRHHKLSVNPDFVASKLESMYNYFDEPFADHASLLNWAISQKAREHVTVVLSGDGADELFWGYPRYNQWQQQRDQAHRKIPFLSSTRSLFSMLPNSRLKYTLGNLTERDQLKIYFDILKPRLLGFMNGVEKDTRLWFTVGLNELINRLDLPSVVDFKTYLPDAMLYKVDRSSMASSLEVRVPYLDNHVIDYALSLPLSEKSGNDFQNKAPLKRLLAQLAPHYPIHSPKKGFNFPLTHWLQHEWKSKVLDLVTAKNLNEVGLDSRRFTWMLDDFFKNGKKHTLEIWYLFNLILWYKKSMPNKWLPK